MINLFETFDSASRDLLISEKIAGMTVPSVAMNDDGFLPEEVDSPIKYFCHLKSNHRPLYFDQIHIPHFWRIMANAQGGQIYDLKTKKANIVFLNPDNSRTVREIQWLDENGNISWVDRYDSHATRFSKVYYDNGQPSVCEYYDLTGRKVIEQNLRSGDIFLNFKGKKRHFNDLPDFVLFFLKEKQYDLNHIIYNTLNQSLAVTLRLPADSGEDMLVWHERLGDELPGNMGFLMDNDTRTSTIAFQNYEDWQAKQDLIPKDSKIKFLYLGTIYPHPRSNQLRSQVLILTNSDQIDQLENLVQLMPNVTINIAAVTEMSSKLLAFGDYPNVEVYPQVSHDKVIELITNCDVYLDINQGNEILDAVRGAFEQNMLILGFHNTLHEPKFVAKQNTYDNNSEAVRLMAQKVLSALVKPQLMGDLIDEQRKEASDVLPKDYQTILGDWVNE